MDVFRSGAALWSIKGAELRGGQFIQYPAWLTQLHGIVAPLLVIYRVSSGRAWTSNTSTQIFKSQDRQQVIGSNKLHEMVFAEHQAIGTETTLGQ
ncbi:hypothetical protein HHX47_DHR3000356 [Lentinula edodes]|nr:hypothetical protein HHX47_DHR3000130 [Lentinula edodes]KAF8828484.1 hypothetical protein HHX47_DHR3000356 [Lentinula edodes]